MTSAAGAVAHRYFHTALCEATACRASALTNRIPRAAFGVSVLDGGAVRFHMEIKNASLCAFASCSFFLSSLSLSYARSFFWLSGVSGLLDIYCTGVSYQLKVQYLERALT